VGSASPPGPARVQADGTISSAQQRPADISTATRETTTALPPITALASFQSTVAGQPVSFPTFPAANVDVSVPALNAEQTEPADIHEANDPALATEPIDPKEFTEPMLSMLLREAIESTEFVDHNDMGMIPPWGSTNASDPGTVRLLPWSRVLPPRAAGPAIPPQEKGAIPARRVTGRHAGGLREGHCGARPGEYRLATAPSPGGSRR
jgi:hypothetical protein